MVTGTSQNKRFNEQNNGCARAQLQRFKEKNNVCARAQVHFLTNVVHGVAVVVS